MASISQKNRLLKIDSPLGKDVLIGEKFEGRESISNLFHFTVTAFSEDPAISPEPIVGKTVTITLGRDQQRFINGYVIELASGHNTASGYRNYTLTMVPWLWFLSQNTDCRIFQNKSTVDILEDIFKQHSFSDYDTSGLRSTYDKREYCVQYNESDFTFISRLLEEEGIAYYFKHTDGKHTLMLCDHVKAYEECPETNLRQSSGSAPGGNHIGVWNHQYRFHTGKWSQADYDYNEPTKALLTTDSTSTSLSGIQQYEHYRYPGLYTTTGAGKQLTQKHLEADEVVHDRIESSSNCPTFYAGGKFTVKQHENKKEAGEYLITSVYHKAVDNTFSGQPEEKDRYSNSFSCMPATVVFRPAITTPKPNVQGPQIALVVGPSSEEIYTDDLGRIKVQFYWDRLGKKDENSSCWMRVVQNWSGKKWGSQFIPRIGHEVIVTFIDGNPDRPLVTGSVYNADNTPPYPNAKKTQSGIKTHSTKGGGADNYNELRFDDKIGEEEVYLQAEKDMNWLVKNDETGKIENDQTLTIENNRTITVTSGNESTTISAGNHSLSVKKNSDTDAENITITGKTSITLKVGQSSIKMTTSGITIKAMQIKVQGKMVNVKGDAMVQIKGGLTKIN